MNFTAGCPQESPVLGGQTGPHFQLLAGAAQPQERKKLPFLAEGGTSKGKQSHGKEHLQHFDSCPFSLLATTVHNKLKVIMFKYFKTLA